MLNNLKAEYQAKLEALQPLEKALAINDYYYERWLLDCEFEEKRNALMAERYQHQYSAGFELLESERLEFEKCQQY